MADRLRPKSLEDFAGQGEIRKFINSYIRADRALPNMIFWGPPGCGKTTLARLLASFVKAHWVSVNAMDTGAKELRSLGEEAHVRKISAFAGALSNQTTVVFIDEIHRLNRGQQDVLLPYTESGDLTLIGATTENPSYELNRALLSRCRVLRFLPLSPNELQSILIRGAEAVGKTLDLWLEPKAQDWLLQWVSGDARRLLGAVDILAAQEQQKAAISVSQLAQILDAAVLNYDKTGDEHHDTISAFIKSIRGSDADAGIYYLARMLAAGEDPVFIARRLVVLASEDVGNADPRALSVAVAGLQAVELIGLPEASINLAQVVTYLSSAPKSNASYKAIKKAEALVAETGSLPIPLSLRSARTQLSKQLGYGQGYRYAHDGEKGHQKMDFLPDQIKTETFYEPTDRGFEKTIRQYLEWMKT